MKKNISEGVIVMRVFITTLQTRIPISSPGITFEFSIDFNECLCSLFLKKFSLVILKVNLP